MGKLKRKVDKKNVNNEEKKGDGHDFSKLLEKMKRTNKGMEGVFGYAPTVSTNGSSKKGEGDKTNKNRGFNYYPVTSEKYGEGVEL